MPDNRLVKVYAVTFAVSVVVLFVLLMLGRDIGIL